MITINILNSKIFDLNVYSVNEILLKTENTKIETCNFISKLYVNNNIDIINSDININTLILDGITDISTDVLKLVNNSKLYINEWRSPPFNPANIPFTLLSSDSINYGSRISCLLVDIPTFVFNVSVVDSGSGFGDDPQLWEIDVQMKGSLSVNTTIYTTDIINGRRDCNPASINITTNGKYQFYTAENLGCEENNPQLIIEAIDNNDITYNFKNLIAFCH